jgi:type II secretory pathway component PulF
MEQGADPWESMATAQLITPAEARALQVTTSSESRSWTLNRFVELKRDRVERRLEMYLSLLQPAATLLIAVVVLVIAVGCLAPIFDLTSALT